MATVPKLILEFLFLDVIHDIFERLRIPANWYLAPSQVTAYDLRFVCNVLLFPRWEGHKIPEYFLETNVALCK